MQLRVGMGTLIGATIGLAAACGSSASTGAKSTSSTTAAASKPALGASVCDAYLRATRDEKQPSKQAAGVLPLLAKIRPGASDRSKLHDLVAAFKDVQSVWSSTDRTTVDAFMEQSRAASGKFATAANAANMNPCPRPDSTATTSTAAGAPATPTWAFNTVATPTSGDGLWVYFDATCPSGTTVTGVTEPWQANPGAPTSFAALVPGLIAGQPFTGAVADSAFAGRPDFSGACA